MKIREVREALRQLAVIHDRLGSRDSAVALRELDEMLQDFDKQTVDAFVKRAVSARTVC
jgi:hypothetical protein